MQAEWTPPGHKRPGEGRFFKATNPGPSGNHTFWARLLQPKETP